MKCNCCGQYISGDTLRGRLVKLAQGESRLYPLLRNGDSGQMHVPSRWLEILEDSEFLDIQYEQSESDGPLTLYRRNQTDIYGPTFTEPDYGELYAHLAQKSLTRGD